MSPNAEVRVNRSTGFIGSKAAIAARIVAVALAVVALVGAGLAASAVEAQAATRHTKAHRHYTKRAKKRAARPTGWRTAKVSWYGPGFYGHGMAGGGTLTPDSMVVAHKTLPFGTRVEFEYNGKSIVVPVQDRGPYVRGREFDLGPGPAVYLGMLSVAKIRYRVLGP
jgi:rare lipoprotein A (peptidoglycan hydrolase)